MLIDTHCHLDLPPLFDQLGPLLAEATAAGVSQWIVPAVHPEGWQRIATLAARYPAVRPAFGIHPLHADLMTASHLDRLEQRASEAVAIGEIGLDANYGDPPQQEALFREQLRIARQHGLPVLVHCRKAIGRTLQILREERADEIGGIMHAFSGSLESARDCIRLGFAISLCGTLTRHQSVKAVLLARELPLEHLVVETDAPDLAPTGRQGINRPAWLRDVVSKLAEIKNCSTETIASATSATARRVIPKL